MTPSKPGANRSYLRGLLKGAGKEYALRKDAAEERVVRREYYSDDAINPRPFYFERFEMKRGRRLKNGTKRACEYGFASDDRVMVVRHPATDEDPACEEFFAYGGHAVESVAYGLSTGHPVLHATLQRFVKGRIVECDVMDVKPPSEFDERYFYKGDRLIGIEATAIGGESAGKKGRWDILYDKKGRYRCLRRFDDDFDMFFVIHWNPEAAPKLDELSNRIYKKLVDLIPKVVRKAKITEPAYCLGLAYDFENDPLPPCIGIGLARERQQWFESRGKEARALLWNPAEYARYEDGSLNLVDKDLDEACEIFCQLILAKFDTWSAQKVLNRVTLKLNERDWSRLLPVTDDFIVYAVDFEGFHLATNLKAGVPQKRLRLLRKRRLL